MKKENNNINYTAKDIRKYLNGELSDSDMQAMEKAALSDPFLADAIEGYEEISKQAESFETGVKELKHRLAERINTNEKKTGVLLMLSKWKVAIAILFILGVTLFTYRYTTYKPSAEIAIQPANDSGSKTQAPVTVQKNADTLKPHKIDASSRKFIAKDKQLQETVTAKKESEASGYSAAPVQTETLRKSSETVSPAQKNDDAVARSKSINIQLDDQISGLRISSEKKVPENYIKGVVVDKKGNPIPFAKVKINGLKKGTFTDNAGFFKLYMNDSRLAALIVSHPPEFESVYTEIEADSTTLTKIEMESSSRDLNGVVAPGIAKSNKKRNQYPSVIGLDSLKEYINANKKISTADSLLEGEEIISFIVNNDGSLSSFKVEQSISPLHDAEILRLIKSGPALKITNGEEQHVRINILF